MKISKIVGIALFGVFYGGSQINAMGMKEDPSYELLQEKYQKVIASQPGPNSVKTLDNLVNQATQLQARYDQEKVINYLVDVLTTLQTLANITQPDWADPAHYQKKILKSSLKRIYQDPKVKLFYDKLAAIAIKKSLLAALEGKDALLPLKIFSPYTAPQIMQYYITRINQQPNPAIIADARERIKKLTQQIQNYGAEVPRFARDRDLLFNVIRVKEDKQPILSPQPLRPATIPLDPAALAAAAAAAGVSPPRTPTRTPSPASSWGEWATPEPSPAPAVSRDVDDPLAEAERAIDLALAVIGASPEPSPAAAAAAEVREPSQEQIDAAKRQLKLTEAKQRAATPAVGIEPLRTVDELTRAYEALLQEPKIGLVGYTLRLLPIAEKLMAIYVANPPRGESVTFLTHDDLQTLLQKNKPLRNNPEISKRIKTLNATLQWSRVQQTNEAERQKRLPRLQAAIQQWDTLPEQKRNNEDRIRALIIQYQQILQQPIGSLAMHVLRLLPIAEELMNIYVANPPAGKHLVFNTHDDLQALLQKNKPLQNNREASKRIKALTTKFHASQRRQNEAAERQRKLQALRRATQR